VRDVVGVSLGERVRGLRSVLVVPSPKFHAQVVPGDVAGGIGELDGLPGVEHA
jgi:hypothetical protein